MGKSFYRAFDNVEIVEAKQKGNTLVLKIKNPTKADAKVKVLVENEDDSEKPLGQNYFPDLQEIYLKAGEVKKFTFRR